MSLLEREHCLAELTRSLRASAQAGCIALVCGEAGIGKTALLEEFTRQQRERRVLWGACDALFTPRPLGPLHDIARQTKGPQLAAVLAGAGRDAIFSTMLDELERGPPSLVVFEDLHWADEATLDLLKFLGRRIHRTRSLLVLSYRDDEAGATHPLRFVIGDLPRACTHRIALDPLSEHAVEQLAHRAGRPAASLHRLTAGNPLFVTEVLASEPESVPASVRDAVLARTLRLPPAAREIAELVSVVPGRTESWLLQEAVAAQGSAIESCLTIGMIRGEDGSLTFRHELARRALEDTLSDVRRQALHARVLAILESRPDVPMARLTHHAAGAHNFDALLRYAPVAGDHAAAVGAHREAAAHFAAALRHAGSRPALERAELNEKLAYECYLTGENDRALEARLCALGIWRAAGLRVREGDSLRWLSRLSWFSGRRAEALDYGSQAVAILESAPAGPELAMAYCNRAQLHMLAHEIDAAIEDSQRTIELAKRWSNDEILCFALATLGTSRLFAGDAAGWPEVEESLRISLARGYHEHAARAYYNLYSMAVSRRQYPLARQFFGPAIEHCEEHDLHSWLLYMLACSARAKFEQGDWTGCSQDAERVLRDPRATPITRIPALTILAHLRVRRGDPGAEQPLNDAIALTGPLRELQRIGTLAVVSAEAAWLAGDAPGVSEAITPAYELARTKQDPRMKGELAIWLYRVGALDETLDGLAEPYSTELSGNWREAADAWKELGCPYEQALVLAIHGDEPERRQALMLFEELGASPAARMVRRQLRADGVTGIPRGARASTLNNPHGLTRREAEILGLLSEGLRNAAIAKRLFVSKKTVDHHVSAILTKLGVPSRAEAVAATRKTSK